MAEQVEVKIQWDDAWKELMMPGHLRYDHASGGTRARNASDSENNSRTPTVMSEPVIKKLTLGGEMR